MKKLTIASLLGLILPLFFVSLSRAQTNSSPAPTSTAPTVNRGYSAGPVDLVHLAYQGLLEAQGIPKYNKLADGYLAGRVTAETLVQAGIDAGRVSANAAQDTGYIQQVDFYLQDLSRDQNDS